MKNLILFCIVSILFTLQKFETKVFENSIIGFVNENKIYQSKDSLTFYFMKANDDNCNIWDKKYFYFFPSSFADYNELFGYKRPLYRGYYKYLKLLDRNDCIDLSAYVEKFINLGIEGEWEADAIGDLQNLIKKKFNENTELFFQLLSKRKDNYIYAFFKFIFDGPIIGNFEERWLIHKSKFPKVCDIMVKAYNDLKIIKNKH